MTETVNASEARKDWSRLLTSVFKGERRVIVEKSGIPVAALISPADLERLEMFEQKRAERFRALSESWQAFADVAPEEVEAEVEKAVSAARKRRH